MVELHNEGVYLSGGVPISGGEGFLPPDEARERTMAYSILRAHSVKESKAQLNIRFDSLASHDITYVGIIQTARGSGLSEFPVPYAMTNCHNSLCAVGGTINEDDHVFGLSAAIKYGGIFVPANLSVIHTYARETLTGCGRMVLGSDSHTRYGALGTMGIGEGGPEIVKQLLCNTYDIPAPKVVLVYLEGRPKHGIGPHDVAIALVAATFGNGFVKNKVLEFAGPGIAELPVEFRNGIDVMTTESTCLSSIWQTDEKVADYYRVHGRPEAYEALAPADGAYYDAMIKIDLSKIECMIAMPYHPSNAYTIREVNANIQDIAVALEKESVEKFGVKADLRSKIKQGRFFADQGIIAGCAGGLYDNICEAAAILQNAGTGNGYFSLSVYPGSAPVGVALSRNGVLTSLMEAGAVIKPAFCGPCFGAGDVPANSGFSIRHTTRNFPNREGSKPNDKQLAMVALMDARSIAATARNHGALTPASECEYTLNMPPYSYDSGIYEKRVYNGYKNAKPEEELRFGPNIADWPKMYPLSKHVFLELAAVIHDEVTTTDELIPSGETSSYRSNPQRLAEFTLSRRCPAYVANSKRVQAEEAQRRDGKAPARLKEALERVGLAGQEADTAMGSVIFACKPGDGSAREQAASCQKVLGGFANICNEFATKRYRSNCINWGILPFTLKEGQVFAYAEGDILIVPDVREAVQSGREDIPAKVLKADGGVEELLLQIKGLTQDEKDIMLEGCLMNYYAAQAKKG